MESSHEPAPSPSEREVYAAPDAVVIGTVESLTNGAQFLNQPGDFTSQID